MERNPIDTIEDIFNVQEWPTQRVSDIEVVADVTGKISRYSLHYIWNHDLIILQFVIALEELEIDTASLPQIYELCGRLNEKIMVGHFDVISEAKAVAFRHGLILPGTRTVSEFLIEDLIESGIETCERFFSAFQFVLFGARSPEEASSMVMIDTVGEA